MKATVQFQQRWLPYGLVAPQLAITLIFFFWPAWQAIEQSFYKVSAFGDSKQFVGLANYVRLWADPLYLEALTTTVWLSLWVVVIGLALALLLALAADHVLKGARFYQTLLILPYAVAPAIVGVLWAFMFAPDLGIVAVWLKQLGLVWQPKLNPQQAMSVLIGASVWKQVSYNFLFFLAGLQAIPKSLLEAAAIDGAKPLRRFKDVVWPLLAPTTFFLIVMNVVYAFFDTFAIIDTITQGGPGTATSTLVYGVYKSAFKSYDYGASGAQSVVLMALVMLLTLLQFKYIEKKIHY